MNPSIFLRQTLSNMALYSNKYINLSRIVRTMFNLYPMYKGITLSITETIEYNQHPYNQYNLSLYSQLDKLNFLTNS